MKLWCLSQVLQFFGGGEVMRRGWRQRCVQGICMRDEWWRIVVAACRAAAGWRVVASAGAWWWRAVLARMMVMVMLVDDTRQKDWIVSQRQFHLIKGVWGVFETAIILDRKKL